MFCNKFLELHSNPGGAIYSRAPAIPMAIANIVLYMISTVGKVKLDYIKTFVKRRIIDYTLTIFFSL